MNICLIMSYVRIMGIVCCLWLFCNSASYSQIRVGGTEVKPVSELPSSVVTFDVERYNIHLDFSDFSSRKLSGFTEIRIKRILNMPTIKFDLAGYTVSKVELLGKTLQYKKDSLKLIITIPEEIQDEYLTLKIHYQGQPPKPLSFGGIYFSDSYIYNLGVGIGAKNPAFGRVWFPCIDNFTDKALYEYYVRVPEAKTAVCNGTLQSRTVHEDRTATYHWKLRDPIPTYLASFAISEYVAVRDTVLLQKGKIPIEIWVPPGQEEATRGSFKNLKLGVQHFESLFGAYLWERIGYVAVPMKGGAMEHATNIAYPVHFIDGSEKEDRLWAHELAHSWFGNLVTCPSAKEMWLNEGFARYCEALYFEGKDGKPSFDRYMQKIQASVLTGTHLRDGGYFAVCPVPDSLTYSSTVYDKGALIAHSLRGCMPDTQYFRALSGYMNTYQFGNGSTAVLEDYLSKAAKRDLKLFFGSWVYNKGYPLFELMGFQTKSISKDSFITTADISQRIIEMKQLANDTPIEVMFTGPNGQIKLSSVIINGESTKAECHSRFKPEAVIIDPYQKMPDAAIDQLYNVGTQDSVLSLTDADMTMSIAKSKQSGIVQLRKIYTPPFVKSPTTAVKTLALSNKYWSIYGMIPNSSKAKLHFKIRPARYFSAEQLKGVEPKTVAVWHRPNPQSDWKMINKAKPFDAYTEIELEVANVQTGEYALGLTNQ
jgi:aminopeptidase N